MYFNFEFILFYATLITGIIALFDMLFLAPRRLRRAKAAKKEATLPVIIDYARSFFPILLVVFLLRSFLFEPFRIPSGSLEPTLLIGDFILVNKFDYGVRLPIVHKKILSYGSPQHGDIVVFRWPPNPSYDFIKRVIGVPGDQVSYINKQIFINGVKVPQIDLNRHFVTSEAGEELLVTEKQEDLLGLKHKIYVNAKKESSNYYNVVIPKGMYFVLGDNRDDSADSRYWGFVPEENIVGKAILVWMSWNGSQSSIRWGRLGRLIN